MSDPFSTAELFGWVEQQTRFGARRPGSRADKANEDFIFDKLKEFGLSNVRREPVPLTHWNPSEASLVVGEDPLPTFPIPYCAFTPADGSEAPLVYADPRAFFSCADWRGKVVVTEISFPALNPSLLLALALGKQDSGETLREMDHPATWIRVGWHLYHWAAKRGAVGFVGVLKDQPGGSCRMFAPYGFKEKDILDKPIPGVWVGRGNSAKLIQAAREGLRARLVVRGTHEPALSHNIVGEIAGKGDEVVVLSTHHDSPFVSPVEDASGVAVVLALARFLAAHRGLNRRIVVLFTSGHFYGSLGTRSFIETHRQDLVARTAVEISIEHIAREAVENAAGELVATGRPEPVGIFVPFNRALTDTVLRKLNANQHERTLLLPAEGPLGDYPPTDGGDWYEAGVPVINYISNPVYLLTDDDALRWVDGERLTTVAKMFAEIIMALDGIPREELARVDFPIRRGLMKLLKTVLRAKSTSFGRKPLY